MSQLNFTAHCDLENQPHHRNVKHFGDPEVSRPTMKKTALADVKNILAQRITNSTKKVQTSANKSEILKKNFLDKENESVKKGYKKQDVNLSQKKEAWLTSHSIVTNEANNDTEQEFIEPACSFCNKLEDDTADIMLNKLTLTKNEIDTLVLEWERPPVVGEKDMRKIEIPVEIPYVEVSIKNWSDLFDYDHDELDCSLLNDIPAVESFDEDNELDFSHLNEAHASNSFEE